MIDPRSAGGSGSLTSRNRRPTRPSYPLKYIDATFDPAKDPPLCTLSADTPADIGISDVFATVCSGAAVPSGIADILGPAQVNMGDAAPPGDERANVAPRLRALQRAERRAHFRDVGVFRILRGHDQE